MGTALVTGANRGLELEVTRRLLAKGWEVRMGVRDLSKGEAAARSLAGDVKVVPLDVADRTAAAEAFARTGPVDVLINNAGIHYDHWQRATRADWDIIQEAFAVNLFGAWVLSQAYAPAMRANGWGRIVNVSSEAGSLADMSGGTPAYSTSKAALDAFTRCLAGKLAGSGVLVNSVCLGWTDTDMGQGGRPVNDGAASIVWAATLRDDGLSGEFFGAGRRLPW